MTGGGDPWAGTTVERAAPGPRPRRRLPGGPNLPYLGLIFVSLAVLGFYLMTANPFSSDGTAAATTATTVPEGTTTTVATTGATADTTTTVAPQPGSGITAPTLPPDAGPLQGLALQQVATGIPFPVFATAVPGDDRIFVLERQGRIDVIDPDTGVSAYLNLLGLVNSGGIENGLLGFAFHPDFDDNGRMFVYYTDADLNSQISEFRATSAGAATVDVSTEKSLLNIHQRGIRHRAGMLQFGPDGLLYIAVGDGGLGDHSAQDLQSYQGNILRIDVDGGDPYGIPPDNPYAGGGGLGEIWAHGLRNPWRFTIDAASGTIYIADVGQERVEEINAQPLSASGLDYGWPNFEGSDCYKPTDGCEMTGWEAPILTYSHEEGCSVTGGYVYRGSLIPELFGHYFYADWCNGWIRSLLYANGEISQQQDWSTDLEDAGQVASFGLDGNGELLVVDSNGSIYRIVAVR